MKSSTVLVMWTLMAAHSPAQSVPPPIIDMHLHAWRTTGQGPPPVSLCSPPTSYPPADQVVGWNATFTSLLKNPPCDNPLSSPMTDIELMERTFAIMERRNIYGVASGPLVEQWRKEGGGRIIPGLGFTLGTDAP